MDVESLSESDWVVIDQLLGEALTLDRKARDRWLRQQGPSSLRLTLERSLTYAARVETSGFLARLLDFVSDRLEHTCPLEAGDLVGGYRLIRQIGRSGMGEEPHRPAG